NADIAPARDDYVRREHHHDEANAREEQAPREFGNARRSFSTLAERYPDRGEHRGERDHEYGVSRLEPERRHLPSEHDSIRKIPREQIERGRCLLEGGPENRREEEQKNDDDDALLLLAGQYATDKQVDEIQQRRADDDVCHLLGK